MGVSCGYSPLTKIVTFEEGCLKTDDEVILMTSQFTCALTLTAVVSLYC